MHARSSSGILILSDWKVTSIPSLSANTAWMHRRLWFLLQRRTDLIRAPPIASASFSPAWKTNTGAAKECGDKGGTLFLRVQ